MGPKEKQIGGQRRENRRQGGNGEQPHCFQYALSMKKKPRTASTRGYIPPAISFLNLQVTGMFFRFLFFSTKNRSDRPGRLSELVHRIDRSTNRLSKQLHQGISGAHNPNLKAWRYFRFDLATLWPPASPDQNCMIAQCPALCGGMPSRGHVALAIVPFPRHAPLKDCPLQPPTASISIWLFRCPGASRFEMEYVGQISAGVSLDSWIFRALQEHI